MCVKVGATSSTCPENKTNMFENKTKSDWRLPVWICMVVFLLEACFK